MSEKIKVLIVDDDPFIQESLKIILNLDENIEVLATCSNGQEALDWIKQQTEHVDVVLMDIRMPICDGVEGTKLIKEHSVNTKIVILTTFKDDDFIIQALQYGASGYLLKNIPPDQIIESIKMVHRGSMLIHPEIANKVTSFIQQPLLTQSTPVNIKEFGLTETDYSIILKISEGLSNKEISSALFLSEGTVKNYISDILRKLSLRDRTQIAIFYFNHLKS